jgi:SAM-dependent methyltransferase
MGWGYYLNNKKSKRIEVELDEERWKRDSYGILRHSSARKILSRTGCRRLIELRLAPINSFSRYGEFELAERFLAMQSGLKTLDIGSPKIFGLILARRYPGEIWLTDIWEEEVNRWAWAADAAGKQSFPQHFQALDARRIPFPDHAFDRVFSISVLEHIEGNGDSEAIREISRVLKPKGILVFSVPAHARRKEQYNLGRMYGREGGSGGHGLFFQRVYDWNTLNSRLIEPSGLILTDAAALGIKHSLMMNFFGYNLLFNRNRLARDNKMVYFLSLPWGHFFPSLSKRYRTLADPRYLSTSPYYYDVVLKLEKR